MSDVSLIRYLYSNVWKCLIRNSHEDFFIFLAKAFNGGLFLGVMVFLDMTNETYTLKYGYCVGVEPGILGEKIKEKSF